MPYDGRSISRNVASLNIVQKMSCKKIFLYFSRFQRNDLQFKEKTSRWIEKTNKIYLLFPEFIKEFFGFMGVCSLFFKIFSIIENPLKLSSKFIKIIFVNNSNFYFAYTSKCPFHLPRTRKKKLTIQMTL